MTPKPEGMVERVADEPQPTTLYECPVCHGDGEIYRGHPNDPSPSGERCRYCNGAGEVEDDIWLIGEDDVFALLDDEEAALSSPQPEG